MMITRSNTATAIVGAKRFYTTDDLRLKAKVPIFKSKDDINTEHIAIGKLKEAEHSVALYNLEFISIDSIVNLSSEQLTRLVVIPKGVEQRLERLEAELLKFRPSTPNEPPKKTKI
eukprot:gene8061-9471_t